ncbi:penicillin-binding transpeptidase domain-containing protein [Streptomyces huiliensis]|uniref:penicillin-binding transpeptidase domain-containing protein n=1 Tax=Streptomyces huiliensis TaxID=2876027 RepID=UPI001CBC4A58|nr:penicillin-binding transpeptidase domain-containing protein [Streptomyces huiliensis]MBZ4323363.1 penicillin-binding protein [Streptomyces huiliensis]
MRTGARAAVAAVAAAVLGGAGYAAYALVDGVDGAAHPAAAPVRTGPPTASEVERTARDFLAAWSRGDVEGAAGLTDNAPGASAALTGYRDDAHVRKAVFEQGAATATEVPFTVTAEIAYKGRTSTWTYASKLGVVRGRTSGRAVVDWRPAVLHPRLTAGETLVTGPAPASAVKVTDRAGRPLDARTYPSLTPVLPELRRRFGEKAVDGRPRVEVRTASASGRGPDGRVLHVVAEGGPAEIRTTLDARAQRAAEAAVAARPEASVVAVRPSTGEILAVADTGARQAGFNAALLGRTAPGSTMKMVTAALLLERGRARADQPLPCPRYTTYGKRFHNVERSENPGATFAQDFAASCNTAFVSLAGRISDGDLAAEAREVFGIGGEDWQTGVTTFDGRVPPDTGAGKAAAMIGQGKVQMNPLTMASVAATVRDGSFRQPHLVDPKRFGLQQARSARSLSPAVAGELRRMMRLTAVSGTGRTAMSGLGGETGAKTGSAEIDGQPRPNGWFAGYRNDVAAAAVVPRGGHGGDSAGPVVAEVLRAG